MDAICSRVLLMRYLAGLYILCAFSLATSARIDINVNDELPCAGTIPRLDPTLEMHNGRAVVWQIPPQPKAIIFMAHGAGESPFLFFDNGPRCPQCTGEVEARRNVLDALDRGYAVVATQSFGFYWDDCAVEASAELSTVIRPGDLITATSFIEMWTRDHSLEHLPLIGWGFSSGGDFAPCLSLTLHLRGLVIMCSSGPEEVLNVATPENFPPTLFVYMPKDEATSHDVRERAATLVQNGVTVRKMIRFPEPLYPLYFAHRIYCLSEEISVKIYESYEAEGFLDSDGYLTFNPAAPGWDSPILKWKSLPFCKETNDLCHVTDVNRELKVAYGKHSRISQLDDQIFDWLDSVALSSNHSDSPSAHVVNVVDLE